MEDILRELYEGRYNGRMTFKPKEEHYRLADERVSKLSDEVINTLKSHGVENADDLVNDWLNAWFNLTEEELIYSYKKGAKLGLELSRELQML